MSSRRWSLVSIQRRSGGITGARRSTVAWISDALAHHVEHLLGGALAAPRPEARSAPAGQDQAVVMRTGFMSDQFSGYP